MPFNPALQDRELHKFIETVDNETAVRVAFAATPGQTPIVVENSVPALQGFMLTTTMDITDTASALPAASLTDRRAISIYNSSNADILYIGSNALVTAGNNLGTTDGWEVAPGETFNTDILDGNTVYAIAAAGKTIRVKILEMK